jgi:hypothetical protein
MGSRFLVPVPALRKQRARKQGQATQDAEFPPKLLSFGQFGIERVSHCLAGSFRFRDIPVGGVLDLFQRPLVIRWSVQIPLRETRQSGAGLFLSIESPLNPYLAHGSRRRPLERGSDSYGGQANPAGQYGVGQESMQIHASHLCPVLNSRERTVNHP